MLISVFSGSINLLVILTLHYFTECPFEGQNRTGCAPHPDCTKYCNDTDEPLKSCLESCVVNGCECPNGTVVDEEKNACVPLSECPGMSFVYCLTIIVHCLNNNYIDTDNYL